MTARRRRSPRENTRGWWGILAGSVAAAAAAVALTSRSVDGLAHERAACVRRTAPSTPPHPISE